MILVKLRRQGVILPRSLHTPLCCSHPVPLSMQDNRDSFASSVVSARLMKSNALVLSGRNNKSTYSKSALDSWHTKSTERQLDWCNKYFLALQVYLPNTVHRVQMEQVCTYVHKCTPVYISTWTKVREMCLAVKCGSIGSSYSVDQPCRAPSKSCGLRMQSQPSKSI